MMTKISKFLIFLLSLSLIFRLDAQETQTMSLEQARSYALKHNVDVKNSKLDVKKSQKKVWETTATGLPQASGSVSYNNNIDRPTQLLPGELIGKPGQYVEVQFGTQHNATMELKANQLIFNGPYLVGLQAAQTYREISQKQKTKTTIETQHSVTQAYYSVLVARANKKVMKKSKKNMQKLLKETKATYEQGMIKETDVDQVKINLSKIENQLNTLNRQIKVGKKLLKFQMGMPMKNEIMLSDSLVDILGNIKLKEVTNQQLNPKNHIEYKIINTKERADYLSMRRKKAQFLPSLSAFFSHQENAMREEFNYLENNDEKWFKSNVIGFQLDVPILSSGQRLARVQQAKIELEKTRNRKRQLKQSLEMNVLQAKTEYQSALEKYQNQKSSLDLSTKIYNKSRKRFRQGVISSREFTQNHNQLLNSQSSYYQAIFELLNSKNKLDKALNNY